MRSRRRPHAPLDIPSEVARWPEGVVVVAADPASWPAALATAAALGAHVAPRDAWERAGGPVVVWVDGDGLGVRGPPRSSAPRRPPLPAVGRGGRDPLLRALGSPVRGTSVLDATAGWGRDAGVMAAAGAQVTMVERSRVMALVLEDALARWSRAGVEVVARLRLVAGEAADVLAASPPGAVDVVYLDPLYEGREARATTAVEIGWLRAVTRWDDGVGRASPTPSELLSLARQVAGRRVVVKRPASAPAFAGVRPSGSLHGRTTRFDLYAPVTPP
jgi:16S rRNA (guanine1516-N2)-methyltransferase